MTRKNKGKPGKRQGWRNSSISLITNNANEKLVCPRLNYFPPTLTTLILNESNWNIRRAGQGGVSALVASLSSTAVFQCI